MRNRLQLIVAGVFLVITLGGIAGYNYRQNQQKKRTDLQRQPLAYAEPSPTQANAPASTLGLSTDSSGSASLQSNISDQSDGSSAPVIPGPESFGQYEKYKTSEQAMYSELEVGTGKTAEAGSKAIVYYKGWLTNGTLFDQSRLDKPGGQLQALSFTIGAHEVITGWEQGVIGMKVGGTRRLIVPPVVGYGEAGKAPIIPPNAVMIFDIQLLDVQ